MWNVYKELKSVAETALRDKDDASVQRLDACLKLHRADLLDLFKNAAKSASDRAAVLAGVDKGLKLERSGAVVFLTSEMTNEALTLSELFDLNEVVAVDLLLTAESEQYFNPGLSRGLVAVLIYFQSKLNLVSSVQMLLQGRPGRTWDVPGSTLQLNGLLDKFLSQMVDAGLVSKILNLLTTFNETSQLNHLQLPQFLAIGPAKHKFKVVELLREINTTLGSCLFYLSCQTGLSKGDTLLLLGTLSTIDQSGEAACHLSDAHMAVLMAVLYSFDLHILELQPEDEDWSSRLPLLTDPSFHKEVSRLLTSSSSSSSSSSSWSQPGLQGLVTLAWSVALTHLSNYHDVGGGVEEMVGCAVEWNAFLFAKASVLSSPSFFREQYYIRRMHLLITDFIHLMPLKVKEMRARVDESVEAMEDGCNYSPHFQHFLEMISSLYKRDPLKLQLSTELWCLNDAVDNRSILNQSIRNSQMSQRRVTLFKFIRLAGDMLTPPLYTAYINMLIGLSTNQHSAHCCFNLLKLNAMTTGSRSSIVSWEHFFSSLDNYYTSLKHEEHHPQPTPQLPSNPYQPLNQSTIYPAPHQQSPYSPQNPYHHHQLSQYQPQHPSTPFDPQPHPHLSPVYTHRRNVISDQDVDGLIAVLNLISTVVEKDQEARVALTESNRGQSLFTIFGLVTCSIPMELKASLLRCLSSFAKTASVAADLWLMMEKAQLLYVVGRNGSINPRGLHIEIDEMEPLTELYPLSRSFIHLLSTLTSHPLTTPLIYGVTPFVNFLKDSILLKAFSRSYKRPSEKWQVCTLSLEVIHKLVDAYDVILSPPDDSSSSSGAAGSSSSPPDPREQLLALFYSENYLLKMVFSIIDQASSSLDKHLPPQERIWMDRASLWCLRLLRTALEKQPSFLHSARKTGSLGVGSTGTDKLLLSVNHRTLKSDHVTNLTRFLMHSCQQAEHCMLTCHIISHLTTTSLNNFIPLLSSDQTYLRELLAAVANCVDCNDPEDGDDDDAGKGGYDCKEDNQENTTANNEKDEEEEDEEMGRGGRGSVRMRVESRRVLMELLLTSVQQSSAHMAYLLCGFDVLKPINTTQLQDPGINHFPRTVIHSLINHLSNPPSPTLTTSPSFCLLAYKFIYHLTSDPHTYSSVLRFLRSHDFLYKQAASFPIGDDNLLPHLSWLLRSLVVDLKVSASNQQRSYVQKIVDLFVKSDSSHLINGDPGQYSSRIIIIITLIDLHPPAPPPIHLGILQTDMVDQLIASCEVLSEKGFRLVDVKRLHKNLVRQCSSLGANLASHKERAFKDIAMLCANVAERNRHRSALHASENAFISCKQLIEIMLTACSSTILSTEERQLFIVTVLQALLDKITSSTPSPQLAPHISGLLLTLCCQLNWSFNLQSPINPSSIYPSIHPSSIHPSQDVSLLTSSTEPVQSILSSSLQSILAGILNYLLSSTPSHYKVRTYLYGGILYCLSMADQPASLRTSLPEEVDRRMVKDFSEQPFEQLSREMMATVSLVAPQLLALLCNDSCDSHDVSKMLSMTVLERLLSKDREHKWLEDAASKGFIHHLITSLADDSSRLEALIHKEGAGSLRGLFIFQSKIALLSRISMTLKGANLLLNHDLMSVLSQCSLLNARLLISNFNRSPVEGQFMPSLLSTYRQRVLFPTLTLTVSLMTSLGPNNVVAIEKVFPFVMSHYELWVAVLSDQHTPPSMESLHELSLISSLISKTANDAAIESSVFMDALYGEMKACTTKLQRLMASLLSRFSLGEVRRGGLVRRIAQHSLRNESGGGGGDGRGGVVDAGKSGGVDGGKIGGVDGGRLAGMETKVMIVIEEILCNSLSLAQSIISKSDPRNAPVSVLFAPSISDAIIQQNRTENDYNLPSHSAPISLGVLVQMLMDGCSVYLRCLKQHQDTRHRHLHVSELSVDEVKELLENEAWTEQLPVQQRLLSCKLLQLLEDESKELKLLKFIIENSLLLLWRHLDFYLVTCQSAESALHQSKYKYAQNDSTMLGTSMGGSMGGSMGNGGMDSSLMGSGVPKELLDVLKRDCIAWINEAFFKALVDVEMSQKHEVGFIGALVRKIKRIVTFNTSQK